MQIHIRSCCKRARDINMGMEYMHNDGMYVSYVYADTHTQLLQTSTSYQHGGYGMYAKGTQHNSMYVCIRRHTQKHVNKMNQSHSTPVYMCIHMHTQTHTHNMQIKDQACRHSTKPHEGLRHTHTHTHTGSIPTQRDPATPQGINLSTRCYQHRLTQTHMKTLRNAQNNHMKTHRKRSCTVYGKLIRWKTPKNAQNNHMKTHRKHSCAVYGKLIRWETLKKTQCN